MNTKVKTIFLGIVFLAIPLFVSAAPHNAGTNIISDGTVSMITADGQRRPYTSAGAFLSYGFNTWGSVVQGNAEDLSLPIGSYIPPRDGKIVCSDRGSDKGTCYLITNGKRAAFTSEQVFKSLGFDFSKTLSGDVSFLESDSNINNTTENHRTGVLVNNKGTIYLIGKDGLMGIPDMATLTSWGYSANDAVVANPSDQTLPKSDTVRNRENAALSPTEMKFSPIPLIPPTAKASTTSPVIVVDQCPNMALDQPAIPYGMIKYEDGSCYYPGDDKCQNIAGFQNNVPEGYFKDITGNCLENPKPIVVTPTAPTDTGEVRCFGKLTTSGKFIISVSCRNTYSQTSVKLKSVTLKNSFPVNVILRESGIPTYNGSVDKLDNSGSTAFYSQNITLTGNIPNNTENKAVFEIESNNVVDLWKIYYDFNGQQKELTFVWDGPTYGFLQTN